MSALAAVQTAVYAKLTGDATLMALATGGVHNDVPDGQPYPHVHISKARETANHTLGGPTVGLGWEVLLPIISMSRYQGDAEALAIHGRIVALLNFQPLAVTGYTHVMCQYAPGNEFTGQVLVLPVDKIETRHVIAEFRVLVHQ